jgi:hypothetical protein
MISELLAGFDAIKGQLRVAAPRRPTRPAIKPAVR